MAPSPSAQRGLKRLQELWHRVNRTGHELLEGQEILDSLLASPEAQPAPPITAEALQAFLAPGVTTWTMTSADLPALARWMAGRRA